MFKFISKKIIKNYNDYNNPKVREQYGMLCSIVSIACNIVLVIFKLTMGAINHSIAIQADGLNNLSDVGSNLASLFGFKLANRHPDSEHPYGHGRIEYVAGLIIAFLILLVGFQALKDSIFKIIAPEKVTFTIVAVVILIVSILIKLWMAMFNRTVSKNINSATLMAASQDSLNDVMATSATLISLILSLYTDLPVDGIMGAVVSIIVLKAGIDIFKDTVEVDCNDNIMAVHDAMDLIERSMLEKYHILTTIHMDPVDTNDALTNELKQVVLGVVKGINKEYSIHDFRIVTGPTHTNLIFDVMIPSNDEIKHKVLKEEINTKLRAINPNYYTVMQIEHSFI